MNDGKADGKSIDKEKRKAAKVRWLIILMHEAWGHTLIIHCWYRRWCGRKFPFLSPAINHAHTWQNNTLFLLIHSQLSWWQQTSPSKKCKGDDVSKWLKTVPVSLPHSRSPTTASCGSTNTCVLSLTVGSSDSTTTSVLTQGINITQKKLPHPPTKVEALETYIKVVEDGPISDYDETQGGEREVAMASPAKGHQHVLSEIHTWYAICYII